MNWGHTIGARHSRTIENKTAAAKTANVALRLDSVISCVAASGLEVSTMLPQYKEPYGMCCIEPFRRTWQNLIRFSAWIHPHGQASEVGRPNSRTLRQGRGDSGVC
jgi:hypothetical protein